MQYIWLIISHFIADFLFQTRKMGENKSRSLLWLSAHILVYTAVLCVCTFAADSIYHFEVGTEKLFLFVLANGYLHLITDFFSSKASSYFYKKNNLGLFWWTIGLDQMIHGICLLATCDIYLI